MGDAAHAGGPRPDQSLRVEDLARAADVSVDTIRFYQKRRLLPPPTRRGRIAWYGPEHAERLARIRDLQRRGFSLALIRRMLDGELDAADVPLAAAVAAAAASRRRRHRGAAHARRRRRAAGRAPPDPRGRRARGRARAPQHRRRRRLRHRRRRDRRRRPAAARGRLPARRPPQRSRAATTPPRTRSPKTRCGCSTSTCASRCAAQDLTDDERAERLVAAFRTLLPTVTTLVANHFRRVLLEVAQEHLERSVSPPSSRPRAPSRAGARHDAASSATTASCPPATSKRRRRRGRCSTGSRRRTTG